MQDIRTTKQCENSIRWQTFSFPFCVRYCTLDVLLQMAGIALLFSSVAREWKTTALVVMVTLLAAKLASMVKKNKKRYNLPPGPRGWPIVGYLPFFGQNPFITFNELRKTYGDVISIRMGSWPAVVLNGRDVIQEALLTKGDDFSGRPAFMSSVLYNDGTNMAFSEFGPVWQAHRKITVNVLHTFTNASNSPIEEIVRNEAKTIATEFSLHKNDAFCPTKNMHTAAASMIYQLCYGAHQNIREDESFLSIIETSYLLEEFSRAGSAIDVMPWLRFFMPWAMNKLNGAIQKSYTSRQKKVKEHLENYTESSLRDITDGLIHAGDNLTDQDHVLGLNKNRMVETLDVLHGAATETVGAVLMWFPLLMAAYPDVQEKMFQQINENVGQGREPRLSDRTKLPFVEATIYEVLRFSSSSPIALPHYTLRDTTLGNFDIPEGTVVLANLHSIFVDEELWGDPGNFRPERFLTLGDGSLDRGLVEQLAAFSLGRRRCVGEHVARMELFLFVATLIQRVRIYKPPGQPDYTMEGEQGITRNPVPYEICVASRA